MGFLREHQLDILLFLSGICATLFVMVFFSVSIPIKRRRALGAVELFAMLLLLFDREAYIFRGSPDKVSFVMVRVSNFAVFMLSLCILKAMNQYLRSILSESEDRYDPSRLLTAADILIYIGMALIVISQFTGIYYTFDDLNRYQRGKLILINFALHIIVLCIQMMDIMRRRDRLSKRMFAAIMIFITLPIIASIAQIFLYGLSLTNISIAAPSMTLYLFSLVDMNEKVKNASEREIELLKEEHETMQQLFEQTAMALAGAIDAKDKYTHGHSRRVAEYSQRIAEYAHKDPADVRDIYYSALLHDVGKIGVPDVIINKDGRLTDEEFAAIKAHPTIGSQILSSISISRSLGIGAEYHHERYDGKGYPSGLKGDDIPEIARIIAVADAYDAMTSKRSYRDPLPQQLVREELVKGSGTQFDPKYAGIMLHLIDLDTEYQMKELETPKELSDSSGLICADFGTEFTNGIFLTEEEVRIKLKYTTFSEDTDARPAMLLFDSLDSKVHSCDSDVNKKISNYFEYGEIRLDGSTDCTGARKMETDQSSSGGINAGKLLRKYRKGVSFEITAVRFRDHVKIRIEADGGVFEVITALPDTTRFAYISFTGDHCWISSCSIEKTGAAADKNTIRRIVPEISYINGPAGNVPNIQIDGWMTACTKGEELLKELKIFFHSKSLPTARLIWHCPFIILFSSDNGNVKGANYRELAVIRFDGECWDEKREIDNNLQISKKDEFTGWENWKFVNKQGADCNAEIIRKENCIITHIEYNGLMLKNITTLPDDYPSKVYAAISGDQCAITNIWIKTIS